MSKNQLTRRDFLKTGSKGLAAFGAAAGAIPFLEVPLKAAAAKKSKVIVARDQKAINDRNQCDPTVVARLFDNSLLELTGKKNAAEAWTSLGLKPKDVVAVKINCNTWTIKLSPHRELVDALCRSLGSVLPLNHIIFYERTTGDLRRGGFKANRSATGVRYFGNDEGGGYHPTEKLTRIVTDTADKIINLASMKCVDGDFGVSMFFKNHIGTLRDSDMSRCHGNLDFLTEVNSRPSIRKKTILNLCDALRGTYKRGVPWYGAGIIMGVDPVASEYAAVQFINQKRKQEKISPLPLPGHLKPAQNKYKLGTFAPGSIDIRQL